MAEPAEPQFFPPPPPPQPKSRNTTRIVLIVVAIVVAVCCVGGAGLGFLLFRSVSEAVGPARDAGTRYVADLDAGNWSAANAQTCAATRRLMTEQEFVAGQEAGPKATGYELTGTNVGNYNGRQTATITIEVSYPGGDVRTVQIPMVHEGGQWRPCP
ncbi:Rv0361 family membrane protein [Plantactinospora endophytica]|uniref:DUF4878 domain-containing protein n=1 Tax=Plantactinospora endophytica TaxID=673535 RepID=A0ABQ4DSQ9_9ACTN|nr:hypothetical protein [Plantactinospora endophytica]GIG85498.1 hypothetical protein Pen02_04340 [Plantactinospora endophytica]